MLPSHITTEVIRNASDLVDERDPRLVNELDDGMVVYLEAVVSEIAERLNLGTEQIKELGERVCWRLELLPPGDEKRPGLRERVHAELVAWHRDEYEAAEYADRLLERLKGLGVQL